MAYPVRFPKKNVTLPRVSAYAMKTLRIVLYTITLLLSALPLSARHNHTESGEKKFTLVIDAGHGGHDAGAVGAFSKEKNINLSVALAFGRLVEQNCPDVRVIYTRKTDIFIPLQERADIANRNKADMFISIHTNALPGGRIAYGPETYTLGMARAAANLEVAKRENSVITYESNYEQTYEGFDPSKAESYIIFEFMQDNYMKQSVELARDIQRQYVSHAGRRDKGVHQAGFLVLRKTSMPAVLTELGFISTPDEERYLNSEEGVRKLSQSIYNGFLNYRSAHSKHPLLIPRPVEDEPTAQPKPEPQPEAKPHPDSNPQPETAQAVDAEAPVFKVQIFVSEKKIPATDKRLGGLTDVNYYKDGQQYKYTAGQTASYTEALRRQRELSRQFPGCFVVAFKAGKRIDTATARRESRQK